MDTIEHAVGLWARIEDHLVVELTTIDPAGRYHPALVWVDAAHEPDVAPGWTYADGLFTAPAHQA